MEAILSTARWRLDEESLWVSGEKSEALRRAEYMGQVETVADLWERSARTKDDRTALIEGMRRRWKLSLGKARDRLRYAELFQRRNIRDAAREGLLSQEHLAVLDKTIAEAPEPDRDKVEAALLEHALEFDGAGLKKIANRILLLLDQDGKEPDDPELAAPTREFHFASRRDGSVTFRGTIDQESGAKLAAMISPLAKPTSANDLRSTPQRQGDAFAEIIDLAAGSDNLPEEGGERPHLALTMALTDLQDQTGTADIDSAGPINAASGRRIACDSTVLRVVLGAKSEPLDIGRASRTVPNQIRRALIIRDKGCAFPGCERRPRQCHAHHVIHWANGGPTSLDNLVLVCGRHHRLIHHSDWRVKINDGVPEFWMATNDRAVLRR